MQVDVNVSEKDIGEVKLGGKAPSTVESFANHPFAGEGRKSANHRGRSRTP
jgi:hypothetical protein